MNPTTDYVPGGVDLAELCTHPSPSGRTCLQLQALGLPVAVCDECRELLGQLLASVGLDR